MRVRVLGVLEEDMPQRIRSFDRCMDTRRIISGNLLGMGVCAVVRAVEVGGGAADAVGCVPEEESHDAVRFDHRRRRRVLTVRVDVW